ncbi:hypothetical protein CYMTET_32928 [Cymbomonas tetramitiformis]|uniref:Sfi1 spindle body domain-containing protein n=1 Tax=Cymbomonas tetramitiformis TaxID=36881 RepID=A0AAE0FEC4_9CHLO|nr:hypothetical protein CYMTET_32928 [Cymbomonas tetramitiformis]
MPPPAPSSPLTWRSQREVAHQPAGNSRLGEVSADGRDAPRVLSASARPFEPSTRGASGPTPFFVPRSADRASGSWRAKGGGGTVQRSLEEQYLLAAGAPEPPEPTTPLSTPVMVNPNEHKKRPFDEALHLVAAATPTPPGLTTKKKLGEQVSAAIEKLTTPKLRSKVAVATTDNLGRTSAAIEKLTSTSKLRSKVAVATTDILGTSSRSSGGEPRVQQPVRDTKVVLTTADFSERSSHGAALAAHGTGGARMFQAATLEAARSCSPTSHDGSGPADTLELSSGSIDLDTSYRSLSDHDEDYVGGYCDDGSDDEPYPTSRKRQLRCDREDAFTILARYAMRQWWQQWIEGTCRRRSMDTHHRHVTMRALLCSWHLGVQAKRRRSWVTVAVRQLKIGRAFNAWRQEASRLQNLITDSFAALSLHHLERCMSAWRSAAIFAVQCRRFVVLRDQRVKRASLHRWSKGAAVPELTPSQWATLRRRLRRLGGQQKTVAAITWETPGTTDRSTPSRRMCMSQAATVDLHVQRLQRKHPERQEVEVTIVQVNRPAKLALLGVDIEEVLRVLRHTHFREDSPDPPELGRSFKPTSTWNQYSILTTDDSEDTSAEVSEDPTSTPLTLRNVQARAPRPTQRERAVQVRDLLEHTRQREVTRMERKQRKLAKRKQAKLRRRGGGGDGENTSPTSTSTEENSSATTLSTSCPSSDDSMLSGHSSPGSRKGGRQRRRQAQARRQEQQLQESTTEEFKDVVHSDFTELRPSNEHQASLQLRPDGDGNPVHSKGYQLSQEEEELRRREATSHELQLQALRANMQRVAEESAELQKKLLAEMRQEVQDVAATAILERQHQQVEAQRASEAAAALAEEFRREHVQQMRAASEALAHHQAQASLLRSQEATQHEHRLRDLQRVSDEQRRQLEVAAHEHELLERQLNEGRSVMEAALETVDARTHLEVQHRPTMPETPFSSSTTTVEGSNEVALEAMVVPGSATTVDVRTSRGVSFELQPSDVRRRLSKLDFRSISVPAVIAIRELVLEHSAGREEKMLAERMFHDTARKYREHDLASGSGPPVSDLPASELPSPELAGVALVHHVGLEVAAVTADVRCGRCSRSPTPPVAIWECVLSVLPNMHQETKLVPLCVYCTRGVWPGAFDHFPILGYPRGISIRWANTVKGLSKL